METSSNGRSTQEKMGFQQGLKLDSVENEEDIKKDFDPSLLGSCSE